MKISIIRILAIIAFFTFTPAEGNLPIRLSLYAALFYGVEITNLLSEKKEKLKKHKLIPLLCLVLFTLGFLWAKSGSLNEENLHGDAMSAYAEQMNMMSRNFTIGFLTIIPSILTYGLYGLIELVVAFTKLNKSEAEPAGTGQPM